MLMAIDMNKIEESKRNYLGHVINVIVSWFSEETRALGPEWYVNGQKTLLCVGAFMNHE